MTGETVYYNFTTKKGTSLHGGAEFFPWYSRGPHMVKTSEHTIRVREGYLTTCDIVPPHYRFQSQHLNLVSFLTVQMQDYIALLNNQRSSHGC
jgi:hypothetical protein